MTSFFSELQRRKVYTVAVAYAVVAWLLIQVAATILPIFETPEWVLKAFTALVFLGFPVAVLLAWSFDLTRGGIVRAAGPDSAPGTPSPPGPPAASPSVELPDGPSVAVLPFTNLSGDPQQDLFAEALTADIVSGLTRSSHLFVLAAGATSGMESSDDPVASGRRLGVAYLLRGSVRKAGDHLRVSAQLVDASNGVPAWSNDYDRQLDAENLFALQDDIRERIVATLSDLHGVIYSTRSRQSLRRPTDSLSAWECLSVALAYDRNIGPEAHLRARESLERAIEIDPEFDEAWAHLSWIYSDEEIWGFNPLPNSMERALEAARKGIELNPDNYHNHWLLSRVYYFTGQKDRFFAEARKSLNLNSSDGTTLGLIGMYTAWAGEWERGTDMLRKAQRLNPNHPAYYHSALGLAALHASNPRAALNELLQADLPFFVPHQAFLATAYIELDRPGEATRVIGQLTETFPGITLEEVKQRVAAALPYQPALVDRLTGGLRQLGLPSTTDG